MATHETMDALLGDAPVPYPASALYHEQSRLTPRRAQQLGEQIQAYARSRRALDAGSRWAPVGKRYPACPQLALTSLHRSMLSRRIDKTPLRRVLLDRRTRREGLERPVQLDDLSALLGLGFGVAGEVVLPVEDSAGASDDSTPTMVRRVGRTWPSAGGLYPLEVYPCLLAEVDADDVSRHGYVPTGAYHYEVEPHALARLDHESHADASSVSRSLRQALTPLVLGDEVNAAAAAIVITADFERTQSKYGERGYRFALIEAGHVMQNLLLVAEALDLAAVPIGGFYENELAALLGLDASEESPVYVLLLGGRQSS